MGIDIHLRWDGITSEEEQRQYVGFRVDAGDLGYLREAYHGGPYATYVLLPEAFAAREQGYAAARLAGIDVDHQGGVAIPGATLRGRLEMACGVVIHRARVVYRDELNAESPEVRAFIDFVALVERLEREGRTPRIHASY